MSFVDKIKDLAGKHDDQVDKGLDKVGDAVKGKFGGHDDQIDSVVKKAKDATGPKDQGGQAPGGEGGDNPAPQGPPS